jgi:hypothetical protein
MAEFWLIGNASAVANMSVGRLTLNPIKVNVSSTLRGLQGLKGMTTINGVDVMGGTTEAMNLNINSQLGSVVRDVWVGADVWIVQLLSIIHLISSCKRAT